LPFIHSILFPAIIFIISIILHYWLDQKEFKQFIKIFFIGIAAGIIITVFQDAVKGLYMYSSNPVSVLIKSFLYDGIFISLFIIISLYFLFDKVLGIQLTINWSLTSIIIFSYICGIYTVINIAQVHDKLYPENFLFYFSYLPYICFITLILGLGIPNFIDAYNLLNKILWAVFTIGITIIASALYNFYVYYNYLEHYLIIIPFAAAAFAFEMLDFKDFRK